MAENRKKEDIALLLNGLFNKITEKEEFVDKIIYNIMTEAVAKIDDNSDLNYSISFNIPVTVKILNNEPKIKNNNDLKSDDICALIQILGENIYDCHSKDVEIIKKPQDPTTITADPRMELWDQYYKSDNTSERMIIFHKLLENDCLHLKEPA